MNRSTKRTRSRRRGITHVELMLGGGASLALLLGGYAAFAISESDAKLTQARNTADEILSAAERWQSEHGRAGCPTLSQLVEDSLLDRSQRMDDPWGSRYRIRCDGNRLVVRSPGKDRRGNTDDDVARSSGPES